MWRTLGIAQLLLLTLHLHQGSGQDVPCSEIDTSCRDCIAHSPECVWCPLPPAAVQPQRCRDRNSTLTCEGETVNDPEPLFSITEDDDFSDIQQVRPQEIVLQLRRGVPIEFNITVRPAENFPLDVYILLDLSASLSNRLDELRNDLETIVEGLTDLSTQFALGFGTFVDKRTLPYALTSYLEATPEGFENIFGEFRCAIERPECADSFSYRHLLSLSNDTDTIQTAIDTAELSSSTDNAEGGLDALLQAVLCTDIIGWRDNSLHLLMFITDDGYHIAGDGRLGGIIRPNDGQCHLELNDTGNFYEYLLDTVYDYPSVDQVAIALRTNQIVPIFTVPDGVLTTYNNLRNRVNAISRALVAPIDNTDTIIGVITQSYLDVTQEVVFNPPEIEGISFEFEPIEGCPMEDRTEGGGCTNLVFNQTVVFRVTVTLDSCEELSGEEIETAINMIGFGATTILLTPLCSCECEAIMP